MKITKVETFQLAWDEAKKNRAAFVRIETALNTPGANRSSPDGP